MPQVTDESKDFFNEVHVARLDLMKDVFELLGYDLGESKPNIVYHNYMDSGFVGGSMVGLEIFGGGGGSPMISSGQTKINAEKVMAMVMSDLGLTKEQAAGIVGPMTSESQVNPGIVNAAEKNGTYKSSGANNEGKPYGDKHCPWSYGAGICQWTFVDRKESAIMGGLGVTREQAKNIITTIGIEGLSLEQQVKMLEYELRTSYKYTLEGIKKCDTAELAAATFYCHALAGYSTSRNPATAQEIAYQNARYSTVGAVSQINKGMQYAKGYVM